MKNNIFDKLLTFLEDLEQGKISYTLEHNRDEAIMVNVTIPGERWEVEFLTDGSVEIERFISAGEIYGEDALDELLVKHSDRGDDELDLLQDVGMTTVAN
ncbi:MAG: hypothetical protein R3264_05910 [Anaerolineae bacterium]|nr:hypothetical protein [Anaerolineae bacterium]